MTRILVFILVATLLLTPLDALQIVTGVRTLGSDPWVTPLKFALVGGVLGALSFLVDPKPHPAKTKAVVLHGLFFAIGYVATVILPNPFYILAALIALVWAQDIISRYVFKVSNLELLPFALVLGTVGPLLEWIDVKRGGFEYISSPGTIPYWLPILWFSGAFLTRALVGRELETPRDYKWLGKFITFIAPAAQAVAMIWYALTPDNIKRLGLIGSFKMAWRMCGWSKQ